MRDLEARGPRPQALADDLLALPLLTDAWRGARTGVDGQSHRAAGPGQYGWDRAEDRAGERRPQAGAAPAALALTSLDAAIAACHWCAATAWWSPTGGTSTRPARRADRYEAVRHEGRTAWSRWP